LAKFNVKFNAKFNVKFRPLGLPGPATSWWWNFVLAI